MATLIPSQTINSEVLWDPSPALPRSCHSPPGCNSSPCSLLLSHAADVASVWIADDDCTDSFTPNQVARMHCYLDLVYQSWQPTKKPAPVAIAPQIVARTSTSVTLEWFPPIDGHFFERWSCSALYSRAGKKMGRGEVEAPLQESSLVMCCARPGLRLFPKLVPTEEVIDLLSALPFSACSTQLKAIDLPCKGQIFLRMLQEEFSIKDSSPVISAVVAAHKYLWASAVPACSPLLLLQHSLCKGKVDLVFTTQSSWARKWLGWRQGQMLPPPLSCRCEMGIEQGRVKVPDPWMWCESHPVGQGRVVCSCLAGMQLYDINNGKCRALGRSCTSLQPIFRAVLPQYDLSKWVVHLNALMQLLDELQELWESWQRTSQMIDLLTLPLTHIPVCISSPALALLFYREQTWSVLQDRSSSEHRRPNLQVY